MTITVPQKTQVSIVLGSYNRLPYLQLTLETVRNELEDFPYEIIVVDGGSTDGSVEWLSTQKDVISIIQHNRGEWRDRPIKKRSWGYFMNLAFKCAGGKYVCMISDDCLIVPGAIRNAYGLFEKELESGRRIGSVAFYWRNWPEQQEYWVGLTFGNKMFVNHGMYLKEALEAVNFIEEDAYLFYHADGDLGLKLWQQGYSCIDAPKSYVEHYSHANEVVRASNLEKVEQDWQSYMKRWSSTYDVSLPGGWLKKSYKDPHNTAEKYFRPLQKKGSFQKTRKSLHRALSKPLREFQKLWRTR